MIIAPLKKGPILMYIFWYFQIKIVILLQHLYYDMKNNFCT